MAAPKLPFTRDAHAWKVLELLGPPAATLHKLRASHTCRQFCDGVVAHRGRGPSFPTTRCDKMLRPVRRMN
jgi:hypothetical protein